MALLEIEVLGGFRVKRSGSDLNGFESGKVRALLAYLIVNSSKPHSREVLATMLWPGRTEQTARRCLSQALSNLRGTIGDRQAKPAHLIINPQTIQFDIHSDHSLDSASFSAALKDCPKICHNQGEICLNEPCPLQRAIDIYLGSFMTGFSVPNSAGFEEWVILTREHLNREATQAIQCRVKCLERHGKLEEAYQLSCRWLDLDPWWEEAHRQVMRFLTFKGRRNEALSHFESLQIVLGDELGVLPEPETIRLSELIKRGLLGRPATLPAFIRGRSSQVGLDPPFFAREGELAQLERNLSASLTGHSRALFITGTTGQGKSALLHEFGRRALSEYPELIVASGSCNAYEGVGDPFLPFRELLAMLTGDVEALWAAGSISQDHARRLWQSLPLTGRALVECGPGLVGSLIPGQSLVNRLANCAAVDLDILCKVEALAKRNSFDSVTDNLAQNDLLTQFANVIKLLSRRKPLLLLLDDLQWSDSRSLSLLFHLGRQIVGHKILLLGAYRSGGSSAEAKSSDVRQPLSLQSVIDELQRLYGIRPIELDLTDNRDFINAFIDSEPNHLGATFRQSLYDHTSGHPLFTIELVRAMRERGDLLQDQGGLWRETGAIDWHTLPARVEATLARRLDNLPNRLRDILSVASIEGKIFNTDVVVEVLGVKKATIIRQLSQELDHRYHLVKPNKIDSKDGDLQSVYRFRHILIQKHLYRQLAAVERGPLHEKVGLALESFYNVNTDDLSPIAGQLARHFEEAKIEDKAVRYLIKAGDWARSLYAHQEAIGYYQRALVFQKKGVDYETTARTLLKLGLAYHKTANYERSRKAYQEGNALFCREWLADVHVRQNLETTAPHAFRVASVQPSTLDFIEALDDGAGRLVNLLFSGLVKLTPSLNVVPDLAYNWEVAKGGSRYIFHLRDDIFWSDGAPVTAGDFVFAWRRILDPTSRSLLPRLLFDIKGAREFYQSPEKDPGTIGIYEKNACTLVIDLERPVSFFPQLVTHFSTFPQPKHIVTANPGVWADPNNIVHNGPFKLTAWNGGEGCELVRNPMYHGRFQGNIHRGAIEFSARHKWVTTLARYTSNELDAIYLPVFLSADMEGALQLVAGDLLPASFLATTKFISLDASRPPFSDIRVRQALALATDKNWLADVILQGRVQPATAGFVPFGIPGYGEQIALPYDSDRARQLLAEAGYPGGQGFPPVEALNITIQTQVSEFLHDQWRKNLGVDIRFQSVAVGVFSQRLNSTDRPHLTLSGWEPTYPDPDNFLRVVVGRYSSWSTEPYEELIQRARIMPDRAGRLAVYQQAERILVEEVPILPLVYARRQMLAKPWVRNWSRHWQDIHIEPH